ncbi:hypothetical protein GCM10010917_11030 [Paenibacillus physcomitrellae]|uniref:Transposase n=1 Tax=Paenibacillus physcomitrellae TaxID=1619311 RepID=A0ABQ1FU08_9BACL|nr:hypothetical protein GCM10010917_11030 [Paenibacillus physcomitrellae]
MLLAAEAFDALSEALLPEELLLLLPQAAKETLNASVSASTADLPNFMT